MIIKEFENHEEMMINVIEIEIKEELKEKKDLLEQYFYECHCAIFLVDLTSEESFEHLNDLIISLEKYEIIKDDSKYLTKILALNKSDLESELKINKEKINEFINQYPSFDSIEINSKDKKGIPELSQKIYKAYTKNENIIYPIDNIKVSDNQINSQSSHIGIDIEDSISCILVGDSATGKSSFLIRYFKNEFSDVFLTTIGLDKEIKIIRIGDKNYKFILWDTAGQERFKSLPGKYFQNSDGILMLFDASKKESFNNVNKWLQDIKMNISENKKTNMYLIANKIDLKRDVTKEEGEKMAKDLGMKYFECSVKLNVNVNEIISHMIMDCYENNKNHTNKTEGKQLKKTTAKKKKSRFC